MLCANWGRCCHEINFRLKKGSVFPERSENMWKSQMFYYELLPTDFWEAFFQVSSRGCTKKVVIYPIPAETPFSAESASRESGTVAIHGISMYIIYTLQLLDIIWQYLTYTHSSFIYIIHMHLSITLVKSSVHFLCLPSVNVQKHSRLYIYIYLPWN